MMARRALLLAILATRPAFGQTLAVERGPHTGTCLDDASLDRAVESRLGRALEKSGTGGRIQVQLRGEPKDGAWVARIVLTDSAGRPQGERELRVDKGDCPHFEQYVALAVALLIDPEAGMDAEPQATSPESPEAAPPPEPKDPTIPIPVAPPPVTLPTVKRIQGQGRRRILVAAPLVAPAAEKSDLPGVSSEWLSRGLQRQLTAMLARNPELTALAWGERLESEPATEQWLRNRSQANSVPTEKEAALNRMLAREAAEYLVVPVVHRWAAQDSLDYSLGQEAQALAVSATVRLYVLHVPSSRLLAPDEFEATLSYGRTEPRPSDGPQAAQIAVEQITNQALDQLRQWPAFRTHLHLTPPSSTRVALPDLPGAELGDGFAFEDDHGQTSGFATLKSASGGHAQLDVKSTGRGQRLVELTEYAPWTIGSYLYTSFRPSYSDPSAADTARAEATHLRTSSLGTAYEFGLGGRGVYAPRNGAHWRGLTGGRWSFIVGQGIALWLELQGGLGYEFNGLASLGLGITPYAQLGAVLLRGSLGKESDTRGRVDGLMGASGGLGVQFEFYRLLGNWSPLLGVEANLVQPFWTGESNDAFLDRKNVSFNSLTIQLGALSRPARFKD